MPHPSKTFYRIREAVSAVGVSASTLRNWETEFRQLKPQRTESGQRRFSEKDIDLCRLIKSMLGQGFGIEDVRMHLDAAYRKYKPRNAFTCNSAKDALRLLSEASEYSSEPHFRSRIEAVSRWIEETDGQN